ncbi:helix-hairpin-helix domain-containing protein [Georgenia sp. EYE_87]|uniref:helix-hairpin-helix domain-containing protein n=1 Tax=Georgenia sp. EYE_87 TaxID=2853448 RepID=UPI0020033EBE|nr:helix-hairpin-helix domain-containing protein [Georgenia sp. EYE_87]
MEVRRRDRGARLRALTSAAYTAAAGHLELSPEDDVVPARRRWAPSARSAVVAGAAALACALAVAAGAWLGRPGDPVPLPPPPGAGAASDVEPGDVEAGVVETGDDEGRSGAAEGTTADGASATTGGGDPAAPTGSARPSVVVVHVAGAVSAPGVVELPAGARVGEAVDAVGGATGEADLGAVNLARLLVDGEQVYVPLEGERPPGADEGGGAAAAGAGAARTDGTGGGAPAGAPVNLNTATAAELDSLPGVGPAIAQRILDWRDLNGSFTSVDDLDEVSGIGPATLERLRPLVTV